MRANSTRNDSGGEDDKLSETSNSAYDGETICDDSDRDTKNPSIPLDIDHVERQILLYNRQNPLFKETFRKMLKESHKNQQHK